MTALAGDRSTPERGTETHAFVSGAGAVIRRGALVGVDAAGNLFPAGAQAGLTIAGVAQVSTAEGPWPVTITQAALPTGGVVTQAGASGVSIPVRRGRAFAFANSAAADLIGPGDWGKAAYAVDDQTVAKTDGGGTRPLAGTIRGVDSAGVWVQV